MRRGLWRNADAGDARPADGITTGLGGRVFVSPLWRECARCLAMGMQTTVEAALSEQWLRRMDEPLAYDKKPRDEFRPDKPFWLTETTDAVCGGNPWARSFLTVRSALP